MRLTAAQLNRATLARQLLLGRERLDVSDAVRRVLALQGQHPASPYLALWNRVTGLDPAELDAAFAGGALVKATLMRITLHVVHAGDLHPLHTAMQPTLRAAGLGDTRFTSTGARAADVEALLPDLLDLVREPRTAAELQAWLGERLGVAPAGVWRAVRCFAPLRHAPTGGPWSFGTRPAYVPAPPPPADGLTPDDALPVLVRRYLQAFGPASVADVAQFAMVQRSRVRAALERLSGTVERFEGPSGTELVDVPGAAVPDGDIPAPPRLMAMWDSVLLAYADRSRVLPPEYRRLVTRANGDVLPTLLVDGYVAGVWRAVDDGIEATAFHPLPRAAWDGLAAEAQALRVLLADRDPEVYRRYHHWWAGLPAAQVRMLPG